MNTRLKEIIDYYNISVNEFSQKISLSEGTIRKILKENTSIGSGNLAKIYEIFPELNLDWLITGRGSMFYSQNREQITPSESSDTNKAIADERERTIQILQETNANLLKEIDQLRNYVHVTSNKYIDIVEQTLEAAKQTNGTVQQLQAQIGFHHAELHGRIAAHHKDKNH